MCGYPIRVHFRRSIKVLQIITFIIKFLFIVFDLRILKLTHLSQTKYVSILPYYREGQSDDDEFLLQSVNLFPQTFFKNYSTLYPHLPISGLLSFSLVSV